MPNVGMVCYTVGIQKKYQMTKVLEGKLNNLKYVERTQSYALTSLRKNKI